MGEPFFYYKALKLGDLVKDHPRVRVVFGDVEKKSPLYGGKKSIARRGAGAHYEVELSIVVVKGSRSAAAYFGAKLDLLKNLASFAGPMPGPTANYSPAGLLAYCASDTALAAGGSYVGKVDTVASSAGFTTYTLVSSFAPATIAAGTKLLIVDNGRTHHELVTVNATPTSSQVKVADPAYAFGSEAELFKPAWWLPDCVLDGSVDVGKDDDREFARTKDIVVKFVGTADPAWQ